MKQPSQLGLNRTGIATSPRLTDEMLKDILPPSSTGDFRALYALRNEYIPAPEPIGTVPLPTTLRGITSTVLETIKGDQPGVFLDKLGERAAFERTGTRLYDLLLSKCSKGSNGQEVLQDSFRTIRDEEAQHFELLTEAIKSMGGDPTVMTPDADINAVMSTGLVQVLADPRTTLQQSLQAILVAELADRDGWELLIILAKDMNLDELANKFRGALADEQRHLTEIRGLFTRLVRGK